jgi:hypothetical protein
MTRSTIGPRRGALAAGLGVLGAFVAGCTRVVDLDVAEGTKRLVVEARLESIKGDARGRQHVRLSLTDGFATAGTPPPATGASVEVTDEPGARFTFLEVPGTPGLYAAENLVPMIGAPYTLTIVYQGQRYQATERVVAVAPIDSLYFVYQEKTIGRKPGFRPAIDYADPVGVGNDYFWELAVNDSLRLSRDPGNRFRVISEDRFYDGGRITGYQPYDEEIVNTGDRVMMRQIGLSEAGFRYYAALFEQSNGGGSPFSVPPASVKGNVANLTTPSLYPLGYFLASEVSERRAVVGTH